MRLPLAGVAIYLALERFWWFLRKPHPIVYLVSGAMCAQASLLLILQIMQHDASSPEVGRALSELALPAAALILPLGIIGAVTAGESRFTKLDVAAIVVTTTPIVLGLWTNVLYAPSTIVIVDVTGATHYAAELTVTGVVILIADTVIGAGYVFWAFRRDRGLLIQSSRNILRVAAAVVVVMAINDVLLWGGYIDSVDIFDYGLALLSLSFAWAYYKRATREIRSLEQKRRSREIYLARSVDAQEAERARIARELHDATGQKLAALNMRLRALENEVSDEVAPKISELRQLARETAEELRQISRGLHPSILDDLGLAAALRACGEEIEASHDLPVDVLALDRAGTRLESDVELGLYRIAQEALHNAARHADAHRASVVLEWHANRVRLIVEDDGRGMENEVASGLGLQSMRDRAEFLGGDLSVETSASGTSVCATIPLGPTAGGI